MSENEINALILAHWLPAFDQIRGAVERGGEWPDLFVCVGVWFVSGILYEAHNRPLLNDTTYDALSKCLLERHAAVLALGARISRDELTAGTAMNWKEYIRPYHRIAEALR